MNKTKDEKKRSDTHDAGGQTDLRADMLVGEDDEGGDESMDDEREGDGCKSWLALHRLIQDLVDVI